jgi:two-component system chemotaxis sensor kinase CheA
VRIKIPLTLAIISALIVGNGGQAFAIPQIGIVELVRVSDDNRQLVEEVHGAPVFRLRDRLLPLVRLDALLGLPSAPEAQDFNIVVAQVGESRFGIVVDEVFDTQEIVVKPIGRLVKDIALFAGTTILGDGRVIMILDAAAISARARAVATGAEAQAPLPGEATEWSEAAERSSLLLFKCGAGANKAVPLSLVTRLEEFPVTKIEFAANGCLVQYRGALLPLVPASDTLEIGAIDPRPVIVFSDGHRSMGLMVDRILDIVEAAVKIETTGGRPGILGAAIIDGQATEVIDTYFYLQQACGDWFSTGGEREKPRVLFAEGSDFYRELLSPVLRTAGYAVATCRDGEQALRRFERGERFDLALVDLRLPGVGGIELASRLKGHPRWCDVPLVALAERLSLHDGDRAVMAGFERAVLKFDRDAILGAVRQALSVAKEMAI